MKPNSLLIDGKLPARTVCPFKKECRMKQCHHLGEEHRVPFSCAAARAYDMIKRNK